MQHTIEGCPGEYEQRLVFHTIRYHGELVVIDQVPAEVCTVCGDVLFIPDTVRRIESLPRDGRRPDGSVSLFQYA